MDTCVTAFIATVGGAVMLSKLHQNPLHMYQAVAYLTRYIEIGVHASYLVCGVDLAVFA